MSYPVYYPVEGDTLPIFFDSFDGGSGASITMTGLAVTDIEIYRDGGTTQRASDAGFTLLDTDGIDFDGITGIHGFSIDLSDDTDSGFFSVGPWYHVIVSAITVDGQTVNFIAAAFRIVSATRGMAGTALPAAAAEALGGLFTRGTGAGQINQDVDGRVDTNLAAVSQDAAAADNLEAWYQQAPFLAGTVTNTPSDGAAFRDSTKSATNDFYNGSVVVFVSGTNQGIARKVEDYDGTNKEFIFTAVPFPATIGNGDAYLLIGRID